MTAMHFLRPAFVESFPATMDRGVLYIAILYRTCGHMCCCGCGQEVITPRCVHTTIADTVVIHLRRRERVPDPLGRQLDVAMPIALLGGLDRRE